MLPILKKVTVSFVFFLLLFVGVLFSPLNTIHAQLQSCVSITSPDINGLNFESGTRTSVSFTIRKSGMPTTEEYSIAAQTPNGILLSERVPIDRNDGERSVTLTPSSAVTSPLAFGRLTQISNDNETGAQVRQIVVQIRSAGIWKSNCVIGTYTINPSSFFECTAPPRVYQKRQIEGEEVSCYEQGCIDTRQPVLIEIPSLENPSTGEKYTGVVGANGGRRNTAFGEVALNASNGIVSESTLVEANNTTGTWSFSFWPPSSVGSREFANCAVEFELVSTCSNEANQCVQTPPTQATSGDVNFDLCSQASGEQETACKNCLAKGGINTAVGCIGTEPQSIIKAVVQIGVGIAGGIALLMTLVGGFMLTTSQGDPKRTQEGKDMITASVIGIIFVLFSVVILQFIGVTIFRLPGFGT